MCNGPVFRLGLQSSCSQVPQPVLPGPRLLAQVHARKSRRCITARTGSQSRELDEHSEATLKELTEYVMANKKELDDFVVSKHKEVQKSKQEARQQRIQYLRLLRAANCVMLVLASFTRPMLMILVCLAMLRQWFWNEFKVTGFANVSHYSV